MEPDDNDEKIEKLTRDEILKLLKNSELDGLMTWNVSLDMFSIEEKISRDY